MLGDSISRKIKSVFLVTGLAFSFGSWGADFQIAKIRSDLIEAEVSSEGGNIVRLELLKHKATGNPTKNYALLQNNEKHTYVAQSGLGGQGMPTHKTPFHLQSNEAVLQDGAQEVSLTLEGPKSLEGVSVKKIITLQRGSYVVKISHEIENAGTVPLNSVAYFQFSRDSKPPEERSFFGSQGYTGPAFFSEEIGFKKIDFSDIDKKMVKLPEKSSDGWVAMLQRYFVAGWDIGSGDREFYARKTGEGMYTAGVMKTLGPIMPGSAEHVEGRLYAGPQIHDELNRFIPGFDRVADYGWLRAVCNPLFLLLQAIHSVLGNWGWAILALTLVAKMAFIPISAAGYRSMERLKKLSPELDRIRESCGEDKSKMQQELLSLYQREGVNPLGGCLPILIQIPVFIALYWVLANVVELRGAEWILWINDLSSKDPYYILPVVMGVTSYIQMKMNPTPKDETQAFVISSIPFIVTFIFFWFPSGIVLYLTGTNIFSIMQHFYVGKKMAPEVTNNG